MLLSAHGAGRVARHADLAPGHGPAVQHQQAAEALKLLSGAGTPLAGRLLMLDGRPMAWSEIRMARDPACAVCGKQHAGAL